MIAPNTATPLPSCGPSPLVDRVAIGLGLGGNLGDPVSTIARATEALRARGHVSFDAMSSLYRTAPWGPVQQPDFANACALGTTDLAPRALLAEIKAVEILLGRVEGERWGPRAIDIDILFYAAASVEAPDLVIPHRSLFERAFVLVPLAEIAPDLVIAGRRVGDAAAGVDRSCVIPWQLDPRP